MPVLRPSGTQKRVGDRRAKYIAVVHSYPSVRLLDNGYRRSQCALYAFSSPRKSKIQPPHFHSKPCIHSRNSLPLYNYPKDAPSFPWDILDYVTRAFIDEGSVWRAKRDILQREEGGVLLRDYWYDGINRFGRESRIIKLNFSRISLSGGRRDADVLPIPTMSAQPTWRVHQVNHVSGHIKSRARAALLSSLVPHLSPAASAAVPGREY